MHGKVKYVLHIFINRFLAYLHLIFVKDVLLYKGKQPQLVAMQPIRISHRAQNYITLNNRCQNLGVGATKRTIKKEDVPKKSASPVS